MLMTILIAVVAIICVFLVVVAMQPDEFRITRKGTVAAPAAGVFAQVNDLRKGEAWNPWGKLAPAMKNTYEGAAAGMGAKYSWAGNSKVGEGSMTITESRPHDLIRNRH